MFLPVLEPQEIRRSVSSTMRSPFKRLLFLRPTRVFYERALLQHCSVTSFLVDGIESIESPSERSWPIRMHRPVLSKPSTPSSPVSGHAPLRHRSRQISAPFLPSAARSVIRGELAACCQRVPCSCQMRGKQRPLRLVRSSRRGMEAC